MLREWKLYFDDLQGFCEKVMSYTHGLTREEFEASGLNLPKYCIVDAKISMSKPVTHSDQLAPRYFRHFATYLFRNIFCGFTEKLYVPQRCIVPKLHQTLLHIAATRPELFKGQA